VHLDATITDEDKKDKHHSYLEILDSSEKVLLTSNKCANVTELNAKELTSTKCDNKRLVELDRSGILVFSREESGINKQESEVSRGESDINQNESEASCGESYINQHESEVTSEKSDIKQ
jgi:hypothetical protein